MKKTGWCSCWNGMNQIKILLLSPWLFARWVLYRFRWLSLCPQKVAFSLNGFFLMWFFKCQSIKCFQTLAPFKSCWILKSCFFFWLNPNNYIVIPLLKSIVGPDLNGIMLISERQEEHSFSKYNTVCFIPVELDFASYSFILVFTPHVRTQAVAEWGKRKKMAKRFRGSSSVWACAHHAHHYPACISVCVLEHLNHRAGIMFNYTCNNFKVSLDRETICMLITMTGVIAENKSYSCSLIRPDISALPLSAFPVDAETTCWRWKLFSGRGLAWNAGDVRALAVGGSVLSRFILLKGTSRCRRQGCWGGWAWCHLSHSMDLYSYHGWTVLRSVTPSS